MFRALCRGTVLMALSLPFMTNPAPLRAAVPTPVGTLRSGGIVFLDQAVAQQGSTLYSGDLVRTESSPATISFLRGDFLVLDRQSRAAFQHLSDGCLVRLEKGRLSYAASTARPMTVETGGVTLRRAGSFPSLVEVTLHADGLVLVAVLRGTLSVANLRPEAVSVEAGQFIIVGPRLGQTQDQGPGTAAHGKVSIGEKLRTFQIGHLSHAASVAVLTAELGAVAAGATVIAIGLKESTASPSAP